MLTFYKTCFFAYKVALIALMVFTYFGSATFDLGGADAGLDALSLSFLIMGVVLIGLGLVLQFVHLPVLIKHLLSYIVTLLIFITVLVDVYYIYDSITVDDYTLPFFFLVLFTLLAGISFYAVITKKISPYTERKS